MRDKELNAKFPNYKKIFVKPLYGRVKKLNVLNKCNTKTRVCDGNVKINKISNENVHFGDNPPEGFDSTSINTCKTVNNSVIKPVFSSRLEPKLCMSKSVLNKDYKNVKVQDSVVEIGDDYAKIDYIAVCGNDGNWLRFLPAPRLKDEAWYGVMLRFSLCQAGLAAFLLLWTAVGATLIYCVEGPHEELVSAEFARRQKQIAIDLATELRQITVQSPAWSAAIQRRLAEEKDLTLAARWQGASQNGRLWHPETAVLYLVYVMTALGFVSAVPQTLLGICTTMIYTLVALPVHMILVINLSKALTTLAQPKISKWKQRGNQIWIPNTIWGIPLAIITYYAIGILVFGVLRGKPTLKALAFPSDFTFNGLLDSVSPLERGMYAIYLECGVVLAACLWTVASEWWNKTFGHILAKYHIYTTADETENGK